MAKKLGKATDMLPQFNQGITDKKRQQNKMTKTGWMISIDSKLKIEGIKYRLAQKHGIRVSEQRIIEAIIDLIDESEIVNYFR